MKDSFGVGYGQSGISKLFKCLKIKLKTGRPSNVRKDEAGADVFKKNFTTLTDATSASSIYYQDELRYGTRTELPAGGCPSRTTSLPDSQ